jgi:hypothetical protein
MKCKVLKSKTESKQESKERSDPTSYGMYASIIGSNITVSVAVESSHGFLREECKRRAEDWY